MADYKPFGSPEGEVTLGGINNYRSEVVSRQYRDDGVLVVKLKYYLPVGTIFHISGDQVSYYLHKMSKMDLSYEVRKLQGDIDLADASKFKMYKSVQRTGIFRDVCKDPLSL